MVLSKRCRRSLTHSPVQVVAALTLWKKEVEENGLLVVQGVATYRDHSLQGKLKRTGIRSISLSYGFRAYYRVIKDQVAVVLVEDVNNHDYKAIERLFGR